MTTYFEQAASFDLDHALEVIADDRNYVRAFVPSGFNFVSAEEEADHWREECRDMDAVDDEEVSNG